MSYEIIIAPGGYGGGGGRGPKNNGCGALGVMLGTIVVVVLVIVGISGGFSGLTGSAEAGPSVKVGSVPGFARECTPRHQSETKNCELAKAYAYALLKAKYHNNANTAQKQFKCLDTLWHNESGWDDRITNKSSGAAGIPQALGHGHVFDLGDWRAQIDWGIGYIYGNKNFHDPCSAWTFWQHPTKPPYNSNWY